MKKLTTRPYGGYAKPFDELALRRQIDLEAPLLRWSRALVLLDALESVTRETRSDPDTVTALMTSGLMSKWGKLLAEQLREPLKTRRPRSLFKLVPMLDDLVGATRKVLAENPPKTRARRFAHRRQLSAMRKMLAQ